MPIFWEYFSDQNGQNNLPLACFLIVSSGNRSISSKYRHRSRYWCDIATISAPSGDAEARRLLHRTRPPGTSHLRVPPRLFQHYARRKHHEGLQPLQPQPRRLLRQLAPIHLLLLRLGSCVVADDMQKMKMKMMMKRRRGPLTLGLVTGLDESGSRYDWPFPMLPSTHFVANWSHGSSKQWHWLHWGDTLGLFWDMSSRSGRARTFALLRLQSFHLEDKNDKNHKKTDISLQFRLFFAAFGRRKVPKR